MKKYVFAISVLMMILVIGICCAEGSGQGRAVEWEKVHFTDRNGKTMENYFLTADIYGVAESEDGEVQAACMRLFIGEGGLFFELYAQGNEIPMYNSREEAFTNPIQIGLDNMGLKTEVTAALPGNSSKWVLSNERIGGISISDLVIIELRQFGNARIMIPFYGWGGRKDGVATWVMFSIPSINGDFLRLYSSAEANGWKEAVMTAQ